jgi:hypothetical protein
VTESGTTSGTNVPVSSSGMAATTLPPRRSSVTMRYTKSSLPWATSRICARIWFQFSSMSSLLHALAIATAKASASCPLKRRTKRASLVTHEVTIKSSTPAKSATVPTAMRTPMGNAMRRGTTGSGARFSPSGV